MHRTKRRQSPDIPSFLNYLTMVSVSRKSLISGAILTLYLFAKIQTIIDTVKLLFVFLQTFNIQHPQPKSFYPSPLTEDRDIDLAEDRWDFGMAAGYGLTEFLSEDGVRLVTRDDIDMAVMEDGSCLVVILRGRNLPDSC